MSPGRPPDHVWKEKGSISVELVDGKEVIKSGNLNQLIIYLTSRDSFAGSDFMDPFLVTYHTFTTSDILLCKIAERFGVLFADVRAGANKSPAGQIRRTSLS